MNDARRHQDDEESKWEVVDDDDNGETSFEGLMSLSTRPPPPNDVHNRSTAVASLPQAFLESLKSPAMTGATLVASVESILSSASAAEAAQVEAEEALLPHTHNHNSALRKPTSIPEIDPEADRRTAPELERLVETTEAEEEDSPVVSVLGLDDDLARALASAFPPAEEDGSDPLPDNLFDIASLSEGPLDPMDLPLVEDQGPPPPPASMLDEGPMIMMQTPMMTAPRRDYRLLRLFAGLVLSILTASITVWIAWALARR